MHLIIDGFGANRKMLESEDMVYDLLDKYPSRINMTKVAPPRVFRFIGSKPEDWGVSGFVIIAESHISIHTFPDKQYMSIDMFSCKTFDTDVAIEMIRSYFKVQKYEIKILDRGQEFPNTVRESAQVVRMDRMLKQRSR